MKGNGGGKGGFRKEKSLEILPKIRNEQTFLWKIIFGRRFPGNPAPFKKIKRKHIRKPPIRYRRYHENGCGTLFHFFVNPKWGGGNSFFSGIYENRVT